MTFGFSIKAAGLHITKQRFASGKFQLTKANESVCEHARSLTGDNSGAYMRHIPPGASALGRAAAPRSRRCFLGGIP